MAFEKGSVEIVVVDLGRLWCIMLEVSVIKTPVWSVVPLANAPPWLVGEILDASDEALFVGDEINSWIEDGTSTLVLIEVAKLDIVELNEPDCSIPLFICVLDVDGSLTVLSIDSVVDCSMLKSEMADGIVRRGL